MLSKLLSNPRTIHAQRDYSITCVFVKNHNKSLENETVSYFMPSQHDQVDHSHFFHGYFLAERF